MSGEVYRDASISSTNDEGISKQLGETDFSGYLVIGVRRTEIGGT